MVLWVSQRITSPFFLKPIIRAVFRSRQKGRARAMEQHHGLSEKSTTTLRPGSWAGRGNSTACGWATGRGCEAEQRVEIWAGRPQGSPAGAPDAGAGPALVPRSVQLQSTSGRGLLALVFWPQLQTCQFRASITLLVFSLCNIFYVLFFFKTALVFLMKERKTLMKFRWLCCYLCGSSLTEGLF